jgi:predicted transcriptional regulator
MQRPKRKEAGREMFTTTISLSEEIHRRLKHLAMDQGVPVRDLIREAIEEYLNRQEKEKSSMGSSHLT